MEQTATITSKGSIVPLPVNILGMLHVGLLCIISAFPSKTALLVLQSLILISEL